LPTITLQVSGKKRKNGMKKVAAAMAKNPKIQCQPAYCDSIPPIIGPRAGAKIELNEVYAMYEPRSAEVTRSATQAFARATVPLLPELCTIRRTRSAT
jgi:hypothetical protein